MRSIINISIPPKTAEAIKKRAQRRGFANTSEYIRFLLELDDEVISANELLAMSERAQREYRQGKLKKHTSLSELL